MRVIRVSRTGAEPIDRYDAIGAFAARLAAGHGDAHVYCVYVDPGGRIGEHAAGLDQLFLVVEGSGWASGADGVRVDLSLGEGACFERGEMHAKGSESGMTALMIQVDELRFS
jgi:quercetin dioxygenase-like cupin family protein